ncbi:MAG: hypothetical protein Q8P82_00085 [bacterium]|nr:hypothetical protein [bacterium]
MGFETQRGVPEAEQGMPPVEPAQEQMETAFRETEATLRTFTEHASAEIQRAQQAGDKEWLRLAQTQMRKALDDWEAFIRDREASRKTDPESAPAEEGREAA